MSQNLLNINSGDRSNSELEELINSLWESLLEERKRIDQLENTIKVLKKEKK